jgi:actin-related protein 6
MIYRSLHFGRSKTERRRNFIGDQIEECKDLSGLFYLLPFQKGYLINWDIQRQVWDYVFGDGVLDVNPSEQEIIFAEPIFNFPSIQDTLNEIFFEEYKFQSLLRLPSPTFSALNYAQNHPDSLCSLIVDSGYSFTHIVPFYRNKIMPEAIFRIDVGGKLLTNQLKEIISYRQLHVLDETYVMNQVKEDACYVSQGFVKDMVLTQKSKGVTACDYVLPDFTNRRRGFIRESASTQQQTTEEQCLRLSNERIAIPEVLFHPSDIGIEQMGVVEAIHHAVCLTPSEMHPHLYSNIVLTGGNVLFPGFSKRVESDIRKICPDDYTVRVFTPDNPVTYSWQGGWSLSQTQSGDWPKCVTLAEYKEHGHSICHKTFTETHVYSLSAT